MHSILLHFGILHFQGAQTEIFLQGQLTADVQLLKTDGSTFTAYCDAKGRIIASGWIFEHAGDIYFLLPKTILESTKKQLNRYAVFSKVVVTDVSEKFCIGGCFEVSHREPEGRGDPSGKNTGLPRSLHDLAMTMVRVFPDTQRFFTITPIDTIDPPFTDISAAWQQADFKDRLVLITPETQNLFIPQMLYYEKMGAVSFTKGCYVGQEIIARTQHLGKMKRHVYAGTTTDISIQPGQPLLNTAKEVVGTMAMVIDTPDGKAFLAVISDAMQDSDEAIYTLNSVIVIL